jgi:hypothetical protein
MPQALPATVVATGTHTQSGTIIATCPSRELAHALASLTGGHVCITMTNGVTYSALYADSVTLGAAIQPDYKAGFHVVISYPSTTTTTEA